MQSKEETVKNLINCGTCGYPLTPEERTTLVEKDGVMVKPAPVQPVDFEAIIDDIEAIDCRYRGDPSYDHDAYWMRDEVVALVKRHSSFYTTAAEQPAPTVQEPVAWRAWFDADNGARWLFTLWPEEERLDVKWEPLYIAAQRQWVGLTDEEMKLIDPDGYAEGLPQQIQQALKEKNSGFA
jgi:hypothetical protein